MNFMKKLVICFLGLMLALGGISGLVEAQTKDFGGETITFGGNVEPREEWEGSDKAHLERVEEDFNVNIEFDRRLHDDFTESLRNSVIAGDPFADIIVEAGHIMETMAVEGFVEPLDDYLDEEYYNSLPDMHQDAEKYTAIGETTYGFSVNHDMTTSSTVIIWNKEMFEREGLESLYELQNSGDWTWDKMLEIAQKLTKDTDGDGETDQWGFQGVWPPNWVVVSGTFLSNNAAPVLEEDGKMVYGLDNVEAIETLEFWQDLIDNGVTNPEQEGQELFLKGQLGMLYANAHVVDDISDEMEEDYGMVFFPKGPHGDEYVGHAEPYYLGFLPIGTENPEELIELANALYEVTDEYADVDEYEDEIMEDWGEVARDRETLANFEKLMTQWEPIRYIIGQGNLGESVVGGPINEVINGEQSATEAMEAAEPEAQTWIDEFFGQ
ncbi:MAG: ABC transporter substrate-binding protein [bacterium]